MIKKYRKKPIVIEACQLLWENWNQICTFCNVGKLADNRPQGSQVGSELKLLIPTLEGLMTADEKDWIIKGVKGEFYPCKPDIFEKTYEVVE